jgi:hypothetical protein
MPQTETRARKTLRRIGVARANIAFLCQPEPEQIRPILDRFATRYRISASVMVRAGNDPPTAHQSAAALVKNLDGLLADASGIRGVNRIESELLNEHLRALGAECSAFTLSQQLDDAATNDVQAAVGRFLARDMGSGDFAGGALSPPSSPWS